MKFASYVLAYNQDKWIMKNLENAYPHVDRIYVMYSKLPWAFNPDARTLYPNNFDINVIKDCKYRDKITIIEGDWIYENDQRNEALKKAREDGMDYLMVHDADEFYHDEDFEKLKQIVFDNPNYDSYITKLYVFWKSFKYVLVSPVNGEYVNGSFYAPGGRISGIAETVVNLNHNLTYNNIRLVNGYNRMMTDIVYYHGSYVLSNEEVLRKINTWGHRNDFNGEKWYQEKWLNWTLETKNLHPMYPEQWLYAEEFDNELPEILKNDRYLDSLK